jgi:translation initiation factor 1A
MTKKKRSRGRRAGGDSETPVVAEGQVYGRVLRMLGNGRLLAKCSDGEERQCRIRGNMRRREWVRAGDTVLVCLRELGGDKADVVHRYQPGELQKLDRLGETVRIAVDDDEAAMDELVVFEGDEDDQLPELPRKARPEMPDSSDSDSDIDWVAI